MLYDIPENRIGEVADIASQAFIVAADPVSGYIFEKEMHHLELKRRFFGMLAMECMSKSVKYASSRHLEVISIWFPPGVDYSQDRSEFPFGPGDFGSGETGERLKAAFDTLAYLAAALKKEPQWYLHLFAARPAMRGRGFASSLIRLMLERADKDGLPCSLLTATPENIQRYCHWGFGVVDTAPVLGSDVRFYWMQRDCKNINPKSKYPMSKQIPNPSSKSK